MSRPWHIWLSFAACVCLVASAVGWLSVKALQAEANEAAARVQAVVEENARLALWRMDSAVASLVAQEATRPYFVYEAFYPADRAYGRMFNRVTEGNQLVPSPLQARPSPSVLLNFQFDTANGLTSPQAPVNEPLLPGSQEVASGESVATAKALLEKLKPAFDGPFLLAQVPPLSGEFAIESLDPQAQGAQLTVNSQALRSQNGLFNDEQQLQRGQVEFQARARYVQQNVNDNVGNTQAYAQTINPAEQANSATAAGDEALELPTTEVQLSMMKPLWWGADLLLARRVSASGRDYVQGCVLNWPTIKSKLLADTADLLPHADLVPYEVLPLHDGEAEARDVRLLASLPVRLIPGTVPFATPSGLTPVQLALVVGWGAMLVAASAVAVLLQGVHSLSERRAAFVSAVTHELRTPLTTFRMYSEMLAQGMVQDEADRHRYLETLRVEADRLTHLVANVLSYARLERAKPGGRIESVSVDRLVDVATERLVDRASEAGFTVAVEVPSEVGELRVAADPSMVEQILFNLVDNACKYAAAADDKTLTISAALDRDAVVIRVCDRGPGVSTLGQRRLFQPFRKSADEAAVTAPGVGLGLALSRRLARDMRGDLRYEPGPHGACFALRIPRG